MPSYHVAHRAAVPTQFDAWPSKVVTANHSHFQVRMACGSHFGDRPSLKHYVAASHIAVSPLASVQTIPDKRLAAFGAKRSLCIRVPYFGVALRCLANVGGHGPASTAAFASRS
jgi:hypothetical protein